MPWLTGGIGKSDGGRLRRHVIPWSWRIPTVNPCQAMSGNSSGCDREKIEGAKAVVLRSLLASLGNMALRASLKLLANGKDEVTRVELGGVLQRGDACEVARHAAVFDGLDGRAL